VSEYWDYFPVWEEKYDKPKNYFGRLYLEVNKKTGEALVDCRFGRITNECEHRYNHTGLFKYHLNGTGTWVEVGGVHTITFVGDFEIYEISWSDKKRPKATYTEVWSGALTFEIVINPVPE